MANMSDAFSPIVEQFLAGDSSDESAVAQETVPLVVELPLDKFRKKALVLSDPVKQPVGITNQFPAMKTKVPMAELQADEVTKDIMVLASRMAESYVTVAEASVTCTVSDIHKYFGQKLGGFAFQAQQLGATNWSKSRRVRVLLALRLFTDLPEGNPISAMPMPYVEAKGRR